MSEYTVSRDPAIEERILNGIKDALLEEENERLKVWHISDILNPRQAYLKRKVGARIDNVSALMFIAGQGHHIVIEKAFGADEVVLEYDGVVGTVDMELEDLLHELKTSRTYAVYVPSTLPKGYPSQQRYYMAMKYTDKDEAEGIIDVLHLCPKGTDASGRQVMDPVLRSYRVQYTKLGEARAEISAGRRLIEDALGGVVEFKTLPQCPECLAYKRRKCSYVIECDKLCGI